ncbi:MAG TPA: Type 1 glutamine amidotransferase-like domain-containing protein, partial [Actinomycetota bacterium]|nr:Type 1 glutamine amidotransferase-like domain-containing protein [Actinomycetota bacterium]
MTVRDTSHGGRGPVMVIGGAEDKRGERLVLSRFFEMAGTDPHLVVLSTASMRGEEATARYGELFTEMGAAQVTGLRPLTRDEAADPAGFEALSRADGVFLTGGNQVRLVSVIGGTRLEDALFSARDRGAVIAGTSAGASAVAAHMVAFG